MSPAENAAVLATSGATSKEGGSIGNSYLYVDLAASFIAQWDDEALARRDKAPQKRSHHTAAAATTTWDLSSSSSSFLEPDTMDGGDFEMTLGTDEPWEDQSWEEPEEAEFLDDDWTDEISPDDPELEEQFGSLEAVEAFAVTEFKNASSDMKNATRTFMEAKDLVSRVKHARGYFPVVGVGAFDCFQTITSRGSPQTGAGKGTGTGMNSQTGKGHGRVFRKGKPPRDPRRPSPAKSRVTLTGSTKGGPAHGTRLQPGQCLLCRQTGHLAKDCPNRETRDDSGINHKRAFGSFVGMTAEVSSRIFTRLVITTNQQQEVRRTPYSLCLTCLLQFGCLLYLYWSEYFPLVTMACAIKDKTLLFCWNADGTRDRSDLISNTAANITYSDGYKERCAIDHDPSLLNS